MYNVNIYTNIGVDFLNKASEYRVMPTVALRGLVVFPGMGITFDVGRTRSLHAIKAAMADENEGIFALGRCYKQGIGTEEDWDKALEWFGKGAEKNESRCLTELGLAYENGNGVEENPQKAVEYMTRAAEQDYGYAQFKMGDYYFFGCGPCLEDNKKAVEWYEKAVANEIPMAMLRMGDYYLYDYDSLNESEKAFAYKLKAEALKHQGQRTDLTSEQLAPKLSTELIAEQEGTSKDTVKRYIRLTKLIPDILKMVDEQRIAFSVGVELSYLTENEQQGSFEAIELEDKTPSLSQAIQMKKLSQAGKLDSETISKIISEEKPNQREKIVLRGDRVRSLIPKNIPVSQTEDYVVKALEHYSRFLRQRAERDSR